MQTTVNTAELISRLGAHLKELSDLLLKKDDLFQDPHYSVEVGRHIKTMLSNLGEIRNLVKTEEQHQFAGSTFEIDPEFDDYLQAFNTRMAQLDSAFKSVLTVEEAETSVPGNTTTNYALLSSAFAFAAQEMRELSTHIEALSFPTQVRSIESLSDRAIRRNLGLSGPSVRMRAPRREIWIPLKPNRVGLDPMSEVTEVLGTMGSPELPNFPIGEESETGLSGIVPVMFATERQIRQSSNPFKVTFKGKRNKQSMTYGIAEVSIPKVHRQGRLERPSIWKLQFREDPEKHIVIDSCEVMQMPEWQKQARRQLRLAGSKSAFIFLHGFNVSFEEAIRTTGQIGWDLRFRGILAAFDWCAEGGVLSYDTDADNARLAIPQFIKFLSMLRTQIGVTTIHVIAHSMGNLLLVEALRRLAIKDKKARVFKEVVFAAPDVNADDFKAAIKDIRRKAARYTLYGSGADRAIAVSRKIRNGHPRAGDGGEFLVVVKGVDSIDATSVGEDMLGLGHSYFASKRTVLSDLYYLIQEALPPSERHGLVEQERELMPYWIFSP